MNTLTSSTSAFFWEKIRQEDLPLYFTDRMIKDPKLNTDYAHVRMGRDSYSLLYGYDGHGVYSFGNSFDRKVDKGADPAHSTASVVGKEIHGQKFILADGSVFERGED